MALPMLLMQSCLKDDEKLFEGGDRVQAYLVKAKTVLTSAENGWHLAYFPHRQLKYGGFNYALKFSDDNSVTVWYEEKPGQTRTSTFAMTGDDGPVLTFDTYNEFMHLYAKPSAGEYEAKDGDFEFILLEVTDTQIKLKGKRSGNIMYMTRLDVTPAAYLQTIEDMKALDHGFGGGTMTVDGVNYNATFDMRNRKLTVVNDSNVTVASRSYIFTNTGLQLADTIKVGSVILKDFSFNKTDNTFSASGVTIALESTHRLYSDFVGTFTIKELSKDVTIKSNGDGKTYTITGLTYQGSPVAVYDAYWGSISIAPQWLAEWSNDAYPSINDWLVLTDGETIYYGEDDLATAAVAPGKAIKFVLGSNGMGLMEYAFTKKDLHDKDIEALGLIEEYPITLTWIKK